MKKIALISLFLIVAIIFANSGVAAPPKVGEFQLNEISGSGCGMTLWRQNRAEKNKLVFFNGLEKNSMEMKINGKITKFSRIKASGKEFYGQRTLQTFSNQDGKIMVDVAVKLGAKGEIESVAIKEGTIRVKQNGQEVKVPVIGDAGC
ncbi:hypothetical protein [Iningainema tapete]|uniref:Uncharacterized protein n=1 Tax=Iningainema tapete BLCC-T55 TaxID=2748662 RepID=A0A8J7BZH0_9CYAN|nr:hypothetical protein [Iningainema tapete]MBD2775863.1 hypothetical protein [Iningainema tapete BLCC-T55]